MTDRYITLLTNILARDTTSLILGLAAIGFVGAYYLLKGNGRSIFIACMVLFWIGLLVRYGGLQQ